MFVPPSQLFSGEIVLRETVGQISVGRQVVVTILSPPKDGLVLVSMFGRRMQVETTLPLVEGQTLTLRVHAVTPKVVMKPVAEAMTGVVPQALDRVVEDLVGTFGKVGVAAFDVREVARRVLEHAAEDPETLKRLVSLLQEYARLDASCVSFFFVPMAGEGRRGAARVAIAREGQDYRLHFTMETDALGLVESTVIRGASGIFVEMSAASDDVVAFLKEHAADLALALEPFGVRALDVVRKRPSANPASVDMLV